MRGTTLLQQKKICPLASSNASTDNEVKRLFLLISIQKSNSAESYAPMFPCAACTVRRLSVQENAGLFLLHSLLWVLYIQ